MKKREKIGTIIEFEKDSAEKIEPYHSIYITMEYEVKEDTEKNVSNLAAIYEFQQLCNNEDWTYPSIINIDDKILQSTDISYYDDIMKVIEDGDGDGIDNNADMDFLQIRPIPNVSLQKFISKVNGQSLTGSQTTLTNRENTKYRSNETKDPAKGIKSIEQYKNPNPVSIQAGQNVTYIIRVYNNSSVDVKNVKIKDTLNGSNYSIVSAKEYLGFSGRNSNGKNISFSVNGNEYTISQIPVGQYAELEITVKFNRYQADTISNKAEITSDTDTEYRTVDYDYVKMINTSANVDVSLQKYIVALDGNTTFTTSGDKKLSDKNARKNQLPYHRKDFDAFNKLNTYNNPTYGYIRRLGIEHYYVSNKNEFTTAYQIDGVKQYYNQKSDNPVMTTAGQEVTYTIRVYNNGDTTANTIAVQDDIVWNGSKGEENIRNKTTITKIQATIVGESAEDTATLNDNIANYGIAYDNKTGKLIITELKGKEVAIINITMYISDDTGYDYNAKNLIKNKAYLTSMAQKNNSKYRNVDADFTVMQPTNVSMQKYITSQGNNNSRSGMYAVNDNSIFPKDSSYLHSGKDVTGSIKSKTPYKKDNPVKIEAGDYVTYKIEVYNNSDLNARHVTVTDYKQQNIGTITSIHVSGMGDSNEIYNSQNATNGKNLSQNNISKFTNKNANRKEIEIDKLDAGRSISIYVTIHYDTYQTKQLRNRAWIDTVGQNDINYRTIDADYVKMQEYKVSLQKIVYSVDNDTTSISSFDRWTSWECKENRANNVQDTYKKFDNPVKLKKENEKKVTYAIKVNNDGETNVTVNNINDVISIEGHKATDVFNNSFSAYALYNNQRYDHTTTPYLKIGNMTGNDINSGIKISTNITIQPKTSLTIYLTGTVKADLNITQLVKNHAEIETMTNKNGVQVSDATPNNNDDADYIRLVEYKVSLEKYITRVTDANGGHVVDYANRGGYPTYGTNGKHKENSPVELEVGDKVTFTIKLTNTGDMPVNITQLHDTWTSEEGQYKLVPEGNTNWNSDVSSAKVGYYKNGTKNVDLYAYRLADGGDTHIENATIRPERSTLNISLNIGESKELYLTYYVEVVPQYTNSSKILCNTAQITKITDENNQEVEDADGLENNVDSDWVKTKTYAVSLHKALVTVNGNATQKSQNISHTVASSGQTMNLGNVNGRFNTWESTANKNHTNEQTTNSGSSYSKENSPVTVSSGDSITYSILLRNDGETAITIPEVIDTFLGNGYGNTRRSQLTDIFELNNGDGFDVSAQYNGKTYSCNGQHGNHTNATCCWLGYKNTNNHNEGLKIENNIEITPGTVLTIHLTGKVKLPNISIEEIQNYAYINENRLKNRNNKTVLDTTTNNNDDTDYFKMRDITISGTVWNDKSFNKTSDDYNGLYDRGMGENVLSGIKVYLYRDEINGPIVIAQTTTNSNGIYSFSASSINKSIVTEPCKQHIKAPYQCNGGPHNISTKESLFYWRNMYYSYYIVFEYDGITYTSTKFSDVTSNNTLDSNAKEDNGKVKEYRKDFNNKFATINNASGINYSTKNENGYIPQSNHIYNPNTMAIQSSTNKITLSNNANLEKQLTHVNLGLRGRDVFDLELSSDVYSTKVTVNDQPGEYDYNNNEVTVRKADIMVGRNIVNEDMANIASESRTEASDVNQYIRKTDIDVNQTGANVKPYKATGLQIEVTYKITVKNSSQTDGTATRITDYYDSRYNLENVYDAGGRTLSTQVGESGNGYNSVIITTPANNLTQGNNMEIYLVFTLKDPISTLSGLLENKKLPTYNMAEITEYKTQLAKGQTEYTRGLIDKDSAPGSANREQVRLTTTEGQNTATNGGNPTTVQYYFAGNRLVNLKYEDDTYAAPTLYFATPNGNPDNPDDPDDPGDGSTVRTITGTVFEDKTTTHPTTRIKTGNGKLDPGEVGVYGATVELVEENRGNGIVRYRVTTGSDGKFVIKGFLPGDYYIKYYYGDTPNTVLLHQAGDVNKQSYNGEDYQSTNNTGKNGGEKLNGTSMFWYSYNEAEGISTGTDNASKRNAVSKAVTDFTDAQMTVLNNMRDMVGTYNNVTDTLTANKQYNLEKTKLSNIAATTVTGIKNIIEATKMEARTPDMLLTVEKTELVNGTHKTRRTFGPYLIDNMNFGIAEVPVTTIDLQKHVKSFEIVDSTGKNVLAKGTMENGQWKLEGNVLAPEDIDIQIEEEKLQGAKLQITYTISRDMTVEINFDNTSGVKSTITDLIDFIDNNLSYNENLGNNKDNWTLTTYQDAQNTFKMGSGTVDPEGKIHTTLVKATANNPILKDKDGKVEVDITLEKVLSATDATLEQIVTSTVDTFAYSNTVEIAGIDYTNVTPTDDPSNPGNPGNPSNPGDPSKPGDPNNPDPQRDRIRTPDRYIIIPGVQHDSETSEIITIHPPTGDSSINTMYLVIAGISLVILAGGAFGIKKFMFNGKNK